MSYLKQTTGMETCSARKKLVANGMVAVIVSPGYGAGWSTWGARGQALDGELAQAIIDNKPLTELSAIASKNWPDAYQGGLGDCVVQWVPEGTQFEIKEYDGSESLHIIGNRTYLTA